MNQVLAHTGCPHCGAPALEEICPYCDSLLKELSYRVPTLLRPNLVEHCGQRQLGSHRYLLLGLLAQGQHSRVYLARRHALLSQMVLLKEARDSSHRLEQEWRTIEALRGQDGFLDQCLPLPVGRQHGCFAYGWRSGFVHTLAEVKRQHPQGVEPQNMIWIFNRLLDQLSRLHRLGYQHGALADSHLLVHARDHGLILCGWSQARRGDGRSDLASATQLMQNLLGSYLKNPWKDWLPSLSLYPSAQAIREDLQRLARATFGPPRFHSLPMQ